MGSFDSRWSMVNAQPQLSRAVADRLRLLYQGNSKHGGYHPVPPYLAEVIPEAADVQTKWRDPRPRLKLLLHELECGSTSGRIVEIGANTGFQTLSLAREFPNQKIAAIEVNPAHCEFIATCARIEGLRNIEVVPEALSPLEVAQRWPGATVLDFNVVHHAGSDFAYQGVCDPDGWWERGLPSWLTAVSAFADYWLSSGYRLGGKRGQELHDPADPAGFLRRLTEALPQRQRFTVTAWMAESKDGELEYALADIGDPNGVNEFVARAERIGSYRGEYFRRPILRIRRTI